MIDRILHRPVVALWTLALILYSVNGTPDERSINSELHTHFKHLLPAELSRNLVVEATWLPTLIGKPSCTGNLATYEVADSLVDQDGSWSSNWGVFLRGVMAGFKEDHGAEENAKERGETKILERWMRDYEKARTRVETMNDQARRDYTAWLKEAPRIKAMAVIPEDDLAGPSNDPNLPASVSLDSDSDLFSTLKRILSKTLNTDSPTFDFDLPKDEDGDNIVTFKEFLPSWKDYDLQQAAELVFEKCRRNLQRAKKRSLENSETQDFTGAKGAVLGEVERSRKAIEYGMMEFESIDGYNMPVVETEERRVKAVLPSISTVAALLEQKQDAKKSLWWAPGGQKEPEKESRRSSFEVVEATDTDKTRYRPKYLAKLGSVIVHKTIGNSRLEKRGWFRNLKEKVLGLYHRKANLNFDDLTVKMEGRGPVSDGTQVVLKSSCAASRANSISAKVVDISDPSTSHLTSELFDSPMKKSESQTLWISRSRPHIIRPQRGTRPSESQTPPTTPKSPQRVTLPRPKIAPLKLSRNPRTKNVPIRIFGIPISFLPTHPVVASDTSTESDTESTAPSPVRQNSNNDKGEKFFLTLEFKRLLVYSLKAGLWYQPIPLAHLPESSEKILASYFGESAGQKGLLIKRWTHVVVAEGMNVTVVTKGREGAKTWRMESKGRRIVAKVWGNVVMR